MGPLQGLALQPPAHQVHVLNFEVTEVTVRGPLLMPKWLGCPILKRTTTSSPSKPILARRFYKINRTGWMDLLRRNPILRKKEEDEWREGEEDGEKDSSKFHLLSYSGGQFGHFRFLKWFN